MPAELLAVVAALAWGSSGLGAGVLSRTHPALLVALVAQGAGAVVLVAVALAGGAPSPASLAVGAAGGVAGCVGLVWLYRALSGPSVGLVAPIASAGILAPVLAGLLSGDTLGPGQLAGGAVLLAGLAAVLWVRDPADADPHALRLAAGAAASFGLFYLALGAGTDLGGAAWTTAGARVAAVAALAVAVARARRAAPVPATTGAGGRLAAAAGVGVVDAGGNLAYAAATGAGALTTVSLISAAYPVVTVALAVLVLHQRLSVVRASGVLATVLGLGLLAA
jgi:drug/metabolite transporter (DMT)-like permease